MSFIIISISVLLVVFIVLLIVNHYQKKTFNKNVESHLEQTICSNNSFVTEINRDAPVAIKKEITVNAPIEKVWSVLTDIDNWSKWQSSVTASKLNGELKKGSFFNWKAGGLAFQSRIHTCIADTLFGWTGTTFGAQAIHNWHLTSINNTTSIIVEESLQGIIVSLFSSSFQKSLSTGMTKNLEELKTFCEE